jgi:phosphate transport system substrate-binding protein
LATAVPATSTWNHDDENEEQNVKLRRLLAVGVAAIAASAIIAGCGGDDSGSSDLSGKILIDGSSTVAPLSIGAADAFSADNSGVDIQVGTSGTGAGFEVFCKGETDISDASRAIEDDEKANCAKAGIEFTELRVASDGITNVTPKDANVGKTCITTDELKKIWKKGSTIKNWKDVGPGWNDVPMTLAGPGSQSGTYDFFNEEILGEDANGETNTPRADYSASEDDNVIVTAVKGSEGGLGYFGFSYYEENLDSLTALEVDSGSGCVAPSPETITDGSYKPLARPLFIYVKNTSLAQPHVAAFVRYYVENAVKLAEDNQFVPAPQASLDEDLNKLPS